jgi:hypothetical protein
MSKERELLKQIQQFLACDCEDIYGFAADIEEILTQPEQEPVAWMSTKGEGGLTDDSYYANHKDYVPLYLAPQKREPAQTAREMYQRGHADGVRFAKKEHGLENSGRISILNENQIEEINNFNFEINE